MMATSTKIRDSFTDFFLGKQHLLLPGASLVPDDKSLLFTNAGMVQFKKIFVGQDKAPSPRVTTVQKCLRAGGKHNDLENVGVTSRHHTLFEMLGNFSFGDYFKEQAIFYAWEFITRVCELPIDKLWVTYHHSDLEAYEIWRKKIGVPDNRLVACGDKDNFWSMGATGPCGPCTEIFYDHGPTVAGGPPGSLEQDGDRFVEIWNLVFMQYNQGLDGVRTDLPKPCVDTGSGLERLVAVMQGVHDNYNIDQFKRLIDIIESEAFVKLSRLTQRVVADHMRAIACLLNDGVLPGNEGRGYVLRRILRRAACFLHRDGQVKPILSKLLQVACVDPLLLVMQQQDLAQTISSVAKEEQQFANVIRQGAAEISAMVASGVDRIKGDQAFKLYDTYGLPLDLMKDLAVASKITVDEKGFYACMADQKARSRGSASFTDHSVKAIDVSGETEFIGYEKMKSKASIIALFDKDWQKTSALSGPGYVVLDQSVFYAEGGGQVGDTGILRSESTDFVVQDTKRYQAAIVLYGSTNGLLQLGATVQAQINIDQRQATARNHSATHLLHAALRHILGKHIKQKGSLVSPDLLRFDFSHNKPITEAQIQAIENWVILQIRANLAVETEITSFEKAQKKGAMALFEAKYGEQVRLLSIGSASLELCGGTHVAKLSEIGTFVITSETGVAAGVRRITAVTGHLADQFIMQQRQQLSDLAKQLGGNKSQIQEKLNALQAKSELLASQLITVQKAYVNIKVANISDQPFVTIEQNTDNDILTMLADAAAEKAPFVVLLSKFHAGKHVLIVQSSTKKFKAGVFIKFLSKAFNVKGGGKPGYARGQILEPVTMQQIQSAIDDYIANAS